MSLASSFLFIEYYNCTAVHALSFSIVSFLQVAVLIDTSASMASRLFLVKDKLYRLMQVGARVGSSAFVHVNELEMHCRIRSFVCSPSHIVHTYALSGKAKYMYFGQT